MFDLAGGEARANGSCRTDALQTSRELSLCRRLHNSHVWNFLDRLIRNIGIYSSSDT